jgi:hypothetical protein
MRKFEISPAIAAAMRHRAKAAPFREVGVPLFLELPRYRDIPAASFVEFDAEDDRVEAEGATIGGDDDDDFY